MTTPAEPVSFILTVPGDKRFADTVRAVADRVAQHIGRSEPEARQIAEAVDLLIAGIIDHGLTPVRSRDIAIRVEGDFERLQIEVDYEGHAAHVLERALAGNSAGAMDKMRATMDLVEFGRTDGREFCRLTRTFAGAR